ncbi:TPA: hypothetical protein DCZ39_05155 [Patescibacteria group bacterium]|nr:hypothetical protein [Candidatus Gracilibacteria bacterium]
MFFVGLLCLFPIESQILFTGIYRFPDFSFNFVIYMYSMYDFIWDTRMIEAKVVEKFLHTIPSKYPYFLKHFAIIQKACDFALHAHTGQKRKYS